MTIAGEWLLTNGLGGYALGPYAGPPTRSYHGWLIAATRPPDARMLLVGPIETWLEVDGAATRLDVIETAPGRIEGEPPGAVVADAEGVSVRTVDVRGASVERRAWMVHDANATIVRWRRMDADGARRVRIDVTPLVACRDHHGAADPPAPPADVAIETTPVPAVAVRWGEGLPALRMAASGGTVRGARRRVGVHHREAAERGTIADDTLFAVATFGAALPPGAALTLVLGTEAGSIAALPDPRAADEALRAAIARDDELEETAGISSDDQTGRLVDAADHFLVRRPAGTGGDPASDPGRTVIAGYPWFADWGRDTMISLPGLTLATGRHEDGARILRTWAGLVRDGLLPNHFPDDLRGEPEYHSVDAPLWFLHALGEHERATGSPSLALELRPAVQAILGAYQAGTRFGIAVDPVDGLVRAGEDAIQPTWMDAKVDGVPVTPRHGKPVEIQALWVNALRRAAGWDRLAGLDEDAARHEAAADLAWSSFRDRFWLPEPGWLADVVDGPAGDDLSLRPNQLLALSLPEALVDDATAGRVLDAVERHLVVRGGVRSLAPFEPGYHRHFQGPPAVRDAAYHQGTAWTWLLGPWIDAVARYRGEDAAREALDQALDALDPDGRGAIPEVLEPEPPHEPRGCPWQAWGVAELLRVRRRLFG